MAFTLSLTGCKPISPYDKKAFVAETSARMMNPICPEGVYIADPEVRQMPDGRVYVYGSATNREMPGVPIPTTSYRPPT